MAHLVKEDTTKYDVNDGCFIWCFNDTKYLSMHVVGSLHKNKISSDAFNIGGFEWQLDAYTNKDVFNLFLHLLSKIQNTHTITINYRLYHHESKTSFTTITTFGDDQTQTQYDHGWNDATLHVSQLKAFHQTSISCYINILKIFDKNENKIMYQTPNIIHHPLSVHKISSFQIQWKLNGKHIQNAAIGQSFESKLKYRMFTLRVYPNGLDSYSKGQTILCLQLCALPPNISKMKMKLKLICKETNTEYQEYMTFSNEYNDIIFHWPQVFNKDQTPKPLSPAVLNGQTTDDIVRINDDKRRPSPKNYNTKTFQPLYFKELQLQKTITFIAECYVSKVCDIQGTWYDKYQWQSYFEITNADTTTVHAANNIGIAFAPSQMEWMVHCTPCHDMKSGQYIDSRLCKVWGLQWFLRLFPKGNASNTTDDDCNDDNDCCALFLCLKEIPSQMSHLMVNYRLFCIETSTSCTDIGTFSRDNWCHGFDSNTRHMMIADVFCNDIINIGCYINIINIRNDNTLSYVPPMQLMQTYSFTWLIQHDLMKQFLKCCVGKRYESSIYQNMWCICCYPNGMDLKRSNEIQIVIQQCLFPLKVPEMKVQIKIRCPELNKIFSAVHDLKIVRNTTKSWPMGTLSKRELNGMESISFCVEIIIIEPWMKHRNTLDGDWTQKHYQNPAKNRMLRALIKRYMILHTPSYRITTKEADILKLIRSYYPPNVEYVWSITDSNLLRHFMISKNKQRFESDIFDIGGFRWYLKAYPNGSNSKNRDVFQLFVTLAFLPTGIFQIEASVSLSCDETKTSYTFFAHFSKTHKTWGWHRNLSVEELRWLFIINKLQQLTFRCHLNILKVVSSRNNKSLLYEYPQNSIKEQYHEYNWNINESMMHIFRASPNGKMYESKVFNNMFLIQLYPNGFTENEIGNVRVFTQITSFPPTISQITAKLEISCVEIGIRWLTIATFNISENNWGWNNGILHTDTLYTYNTLTFKTRIHFIELYDDRGYSSYNTIWNTHSVKRRKDKQEMQRFKIISTYIGIYSELEDIIPFIVQRLTGDLTIVDIIALFMYDKDQMIILNKNVREDIRFEVNVNALDPRFISDIVEFNGLNWMLQSFIQKKDEYYTFYNVMLSLISMPCILSEIVIGFRIYCDQTMSSVSGICSLSGQQLNSDYLWMRSSSLSGVDDEELNTFKCAIHVLRIIDNNQEILYQYPSHLEWALDNQLTLKFHIEWILDKRMIRHMRNSVCGQRFESNDVYNELFCMGIAPNGLENDTDEGYAVIYLCICSLPFEMSSMKLKWNIDSPQLGTSTVIEDQLNVSDTLSTVVVHELMDKLKTLSNIRINAEIEVRPYEDKDGEKVRRSYSYISNSARSTREGSGSLNKTRTSVSDS